MTVPEKHQLKIAKSTLKMSIAGAMIMGGMNHKRAYEIVYRTELIPRLKELIAEHGDKEVVWELGRYGWQPQELLTAIQ